MPSPSDFIVIINIERVANKEPIIVKNIVKVAGYLKGDELNMQDLGHAIMGTQKYQYILPFEVISVLLLACIIGAILIARKETDQDPKENTKDK